MWNLRPATRFTMGVSLHGECNAFPCTYIYVKSSRSTLNLNLNFFQQFCALLNFLPHTPCLLFSEVAFHKNLWSCWTSVYSAECSQFWRFYSYSPVKILFRSRTEVHPTIHKHTKAIIYPFPANTGSWPVILILILCINREINSPV